MLLGKYSSCRRGWKEGYAENCRMDPPKTIAGKRAAAPGDCRVQVLRADEAIKLVNRVSEAQD
jgi:hypothetical protein